MGLAVLNVFVIAKHASVLASLSTQHLHSSFLLTLVHRSLNISRC